MFRSASADISLPVADYEHEEFDESNLDYVLSPSRFSAFLSPVFFWDFMTSLH